MSRARTRFGLTLVAALAAAAAAGASQPRPNAVPLEKLKLPPGFQISVFADHVPNARAMALGARGTIFVGSMSERRVYAVIDRDHDGKADDVKIISDRALPQPAGVAFHKGALYVSAVTKIVRFDDIEDHLDAPPAPVVVYNGLPNDGGHTWRFIGVGPDEMLYVGIGAPCNICERLDQPLFATIARMTLDGTGLEVFARGVRNSVGFDWHPVTHDLWFTDNGRDELGDDLPNDELNVAASAGLNFGYPYCHQGDLADPVFGRKHPCSDFVAPAQKMGAHVAAIGMRFYTGAMFPPEYRNAIFIAQHGSWNRSVPSGDRVPTGARSRATSPSSTASSSASDRSRRRARRRSSSAGLRTCCRSRTARCS